ncbi:MAG: cellulase family glycosylhydrolase, partial [Oscillospiraceae bacterium]|nr:cellulase family glycosylhydrolase [Oscillospiraceae bacterium]
MIDVKADFEQSASQIVEEIGFGWNLGNSLDSYIGTTLGCQGVSSETSWGNPRTTQTLIDGVRASGVNTIRVPVTWYNHMNSDYEIDEAWMDRVEEVVNYVLNDDMYCILNVHHDTGENGWLKASSQNLDTKKEMFTAIWKQISERFSKYGDKLIFEGFNEILDDNNEWVNPGQESLNIVNDLNQIFVDTVRLSGGNNAERCLIVNTYAATGNSYVTSNFRLPDDTAEDKLIAECHIYQPFYFTSEFYPEETTWEKNKIYLDEQLDAIYHNFILNDIPAIIGEFGCAYTKDNMDEIISWAKYYVETCESYGIPCIYWDNGSAYKLYNRNDGSVTQEDLLYTMLAAADGTSYEIDTTLYGDANDDGVADILDAVILQKWLLAIPDATLTNWKVVDLDQDEKITVFDLCLLKRLLIQKENLCNSMDHWSSWVDSTGGASAEVTYQKNGISIAVENGGVNPWDAQIAYKNIQLEQGATYRLAFDYSATVAVTSDGNVMQNHDNYLPYHTVNLHYTPEIQHMECEFTMTAPTDKNCEIAFNCGSKDMKPCTITISNLSLVKIS